MGAMSHSPYPCELSKYFLCQTFIASSNVTTAFCNGRVKLPLTILNFLNGAKRIRTADPLNAIEVRYQLRYNPLQFNTTLIFT